MRDTVYFLIFEGFADWQAALALCEIRRPGDWHVQSAGFSTAPVVSMGGLSVQPDLSLAQIDLGRAAMLIVPGGHLWLRGEGSEAVAIIRDARDAGIPVAGIDSGVLALARAAVLDDVRHTGNWAGQIASQVSGYSGEMVYDAAVLAVGDGGVITASHLAALSLPARSFTPCTSTASAIATIGIACSSTRSFRRGVWAQRRWLEERA